MKILVVEDDVDQLSLRALVLASSGFETFEACDSASALQIAGEQAPGCAILDLRLPTEKAGLELIRRFRDLDAQLWIVVLTGADAARFKKLPEAALVNDVLTKPVCSADLVAKLKAIKPKPRSFTAGAGG
jgi:DNA-binding response OmpR family regulator